MSNIDEGWIGEPQTSTAPLRKPLLWVFEPAADITAWELAKLLPYIIMNSPIYEETDLPEGCARHLTFEPKQEVGSG
jgi:hypothetical protein